MARRRRGSGLLGLIAIVVIALLLVAYFQKHDVHLPSFSTPTSTTHNGGLAPMPAYSVRSLMLIRSAQ
jgi:peptidoglycan biosynthesis protein MviN/MurJ (putative lipid II flippase)